MATENETISKRIQRIRKLYAGEDDKTLFAANFVSDAPWDRAANKSRSASKATKFRAPDVFSDMKIVIEDIVERGHQVVVRWRMHGKWAKPLPFVPDVRPTGKAVNVTGINTYHFAGDQVVKKTSAIDGFTLAKQLFGGSDARFDARQCVSMIEAVSLPPERFEQGGPI
jgi:predicted ester cyclase